MQNQLDARASEPRALTGSNPRLPVGSDGLAMGQKNRWVVGLGDSVFSSFFFAENNG
jgi:hypothetical protein